MEARVEERNLEETQKTDKEQQHAPNVQLISKMTCDQDSQEPSLLRDGVLSLSKNMTSEAEAAESQFLYSWQGTSSLLCVTTAIASHSMQMK